MRRFAITFHTTRRHRRPAGAPATARAAAVAVLAVAVLAACVGQRPTTGPPIGPTTAGGPTASPPTSSEAPAVVLPGADPMTKIPVGGYFAGKRPPQFVLFSFDGAADPELMARWRAAADASSARLTFFLSAVYLLGQDNRTIYAPPGHPAGASAIGFSPTPAGRTDAAYITEAVRSLQAAARAGDEIANHYGGHWCGDNGVSAWGKAQWAAELNQVESLVLKVDQNNALNPAVGPPYDPTRVAGSRTPCLEGRFDELYPVLHARGYRYDASNTRGLLEWPQQRKGLWAFGFAGIAITGLARPTLPVDFSISTGFNGEVVKGTLTLEQRNQIQVAVRDAFARTFDQLYFGERTPFEISNHFDSLDGDIYNVAVEEMMRSVCGRPEVVCTTYRNVVDWLDAHVADLPALQNGAFTKLPRS